MKISNELERYSMTADLSIVPQRNLITVWVGASNITLDVTLSDPTTYIFMINIQQSYSGFRFVCNSPTINMRLGSDNIHMIGIDNKAKTWTPLIYSRGGFE